MLATVYRKGLDPQVIVARWHCLCRRRELRHPDRQRAKCEFEPFSLEGTEMEVGDIEVELL